MLFLYNKCTRLDEVQNNAQWSETAEERTLKITQSKLRIVPNIGFVCFFKAQVVKLYLLLYINTVCQQFLDHIVNRLFINY